METLETHSVTIVTSVPWDMEWVLRQRRLYGKILFPLQLKPFIITQCNCTSIGLCNTKKTWLFPSGGQGSGVAGIGLADCWVGTGLGQLEAAEELVRLGRKCCIAWGNFWASVKRSAKPSTAGPNRLPDETGASRKGTLSAFVFHLHHCEPEVAL